MNKSIWETTSEIPTFQPLRGHLKTDVLIVGGGMSGLLCAYRLSQSGIDCALLEAERICGGVTKNTTAKITSQHGLLYDSLIQHFGIEKARMVLDANEAALRQYRELCRDIPCGYEEKRSYVYTLERVDKLEKELAALDMLGHPASFVEELPLPFSTKGAICFEQQAQFHPLQFAAHIAKGLAIYEHSPVLELADHWARTKTGSVTASKIIIATHFPILNKHGSYFLKLYQHRSYVLALENAPNLNGMYVDEADKGMSFRNYENLLFIGGGDHRTGKQGGNWAELSAFTKKHYPDAREVCRWATQDCMSLDGVPYIGQYAGNTPDLYVITGFNKWGMSSSMAAASMMCDLIRGKENPYASAFSPSRTMLRPQLLINGLEAVGNLLTPTHPRCPHLGCALKWNKAEHSWDCPCHGSRFTEDGELLDNPATGDLS